MQQHLPKQAGSRSWARGAAGQQGQGLRMLQRRRWRGAAGLGHSHMSNGRSGLMGMDGQCAGCVMCAATHSPQAHPPAASVTQ